MAPRSKKSVTTDEKEIVTKNTDAVDDAKKSIADAAEKAGSAAEAEAAKEEITEVKKEETPAPAAKRTKTTTKRAPRRTAAAAAAAPAARKVGRPSKKEKEAPVINSSVYIQYQGEEFSESEIEKKVIAAWEGEGKKASAIKRVKLYIKPEDHMAYYVINEGLKNASIGGIQL